LAVATGANRPKAETGGGHAAWPGEDGSRSLDEPNAIVANAVSPRPRRTACLRMLFVSLALGLAVTAMVPEPAVTLPADPPPAPAPAAPEAPAADPPPQAEPAVSEDDPALVDARIPGISDPLAPINRVSYAITQPIDRFILRPAAIVYKTVVPHPLRDGARNAIRNLNDPLIVFNDVLQLRPGRAIRSTVRFILNSTLGLGGLFDVARRKPFHIPHHGNSFGDTLGFYGVKPLLYLYLPVLGPTTLRDFAGEYVDDLAHPRLLYKITHPDSDRPLWKARTNLGTLGTVIRVVGGLDARAEADDDLRRFREDSIDPYAALRASYLQDRAGEIAALKARDGETARDSHFDDPLTDPAAGR
jgi:phospholipid-binding lipoprotein MlaA